LHRRHLNESQRSLAAAKLANMQRGNGAGQRQRDESPDQSSNVGIPTLYISQGEAAKLLNISHSTVIEAKKVLDAGTAEAPRTNPGRIPTAPVFPHHGRFPLAPDS